MKRHWPLLVLVVLAALGFRQSARIHAHQAAQAELKAGLAAAEIASVAAAEPVPPDAGLAAGDHARLRARAARIHQLRGEVTLTQQRHDQLAAAAQKLAASLEARTNQATPAQPPEFPPGYLPRHELADRGNATPEAALETFWWAMSTGNLPKLYAVSAEMAGQPPPENPGVEGDGFPNMFRSFPGYQVVKRENGAAGRLRMGLRTAPGARVVDMILVPTNGQWLVSVESLQKAFEDSPRY